MHLSTRQDPRFPGGGSRDGAIRPTAFDGVGETICTACPMLCGIPGSPAPSAGAVEGLGDCVHAAAWLPNAIDRHATAVRVGATIDGRRASLADAVGEAASRLLAARRVLLTGLESLSLEGIRAAARVAERLGCAFDTGTAEASTPAGPTLARIGGVTAEWEELRDRADLVFLLAIDPTATHPRFIERFLPVRIDGRRRRVVTVGSESPEIGEAQQLHLRVPSDRLVEGSRLLEAAVRGLVSWDDVSMQLELRRDDVRTLEEWLSAARCIGVVHPAAGRQDTPRGIIDGTVAAAAALESIAVAGWVRALARRRAAFAVPLGRAVLGGGPNAAAAAMLATWRYGASGAIARAVATGGRFLPGEADGRRLVARGEVDLVLVAGSLPHWLAAAFPDGDESWSVPPIIHVGPPMGSGPEPSSGTTHASGRDSVVVAIPTAWPGLDENGTLVREDGRSIRAAAWFSSGLPSAVDVLEELVRAIPIAATSGSDRSRRMMNP